VQIELKNASNGDAGAKQHVTAQMWHLCTQCVHQKWQQIIIIDKKWVSFGQK